MGKSVIQVIPTKDFTVYVYFDDGSIKLFDVKPLIDKGGVFRKIQDEDTFQNKCTVLNNTLAWDLAGNFDKASCLDIDPETIHADGQDVSDPLDRGVA